MQVTVELPESFAHQWGDSPDEAGRRVLEDAALEGYREGRLTHRQVGALLGLDYWEVEQFFAARGVPLNYSPADLEADAATLAAIGRAK
jgi:predicted HTH domain antitoxin